MTSKRKVKYTYLDDIDAYRLSLYAADKEVPLFLAGEAVRRLADQHDIDESGAVSMAAIKWLDAYEREALSE